jgi:hypothetical protein
MFQTDRNGAKLLQASHAGRGQKISHDDDAKHDLHTLLLLLLLSQGMGVRISES